MNSFGNILAKYRKEKKMTQPEVCDLLAKENYPISYKALSSWEKDKSQPSLQEFFALCKILEIKDIYEEVFGVNPYSLVKDLSDEGRAKAVDYVDLLVGSGKYKRQMAKIIPINSKTIRLYKTPVSAGTGNFLDNDFYEDVVRDENIPEGADFGVVISGDSMLPKYKDGQTVWVKKSESGVMNDGEIGIFLLDGNAYCKKLKTDNNGTFLVSLNKKYSPISVTEYSDLYAFGAVLD